MVSEVANTEIGLPEVRGLATEVGVCQMADCRRRAKEMTVKRLEKTDGSGEVLACTGCYVAACKRGEVE